MVAENADFFAAVESVMRDARDLNGVELCGVCQGWGVTSYANTATYHRRQIAGQAITADICNRCWGSGNANAPWPARSDI